MNRDGFNKSLWQYYTRDYKPKNRTGSGNTCDVIIVGGGITGVTTALSLQKSGIKCLLIEAQSIGFGTTGGTSAHLNTFFDTPYYQVKKNFGSGSDALLARAATDAISFIKQRMEEYEIDCGFKELPGYLFSRLNEQNEELDQIAVSAKQAGVLVKEIKTIPLAMLFRKAYKFKSQAQFHPIKYIRGLIRAFEELGGKVVSGCRLTDFKDSDRVEVSTSKGNFTTGKIIFATHTPPGLDLLHLRLTPWRSYVMAFTLKEADYHDAVMYDMEDPYHYYRAQEINREKFFITGGEDHKTGHEDDAEQCFKNLETHIRHYFDVDEIKFKWSSQYFESADGLPYIGRLPGHPDNAFVATGFGGNGMIYGTISALIFDDLINKGKNEYEKLFDPNRVKPVAGFVNFIKEGADVVGHLVGDLFKGEKMEGTDEIAPGEGKLVKCKDKRVGIYKDESNAIYMINPICTHMKCTVHWNNSERTWDCPCHGSRFNFDGKLLSGPATRDLEKINVS